MVRWKFTFEKDPEWYTAAAQRGLGKIAHVYLNVTQTCPLNCNYCFAKTRKSGAELTSQEILSFLVLLKKNDVKLLTFCGGEPLIRSDIFELSKAASDIGLNVSLVTSGQLVPEHIKNIEDSGVKRIQLSLDGMSSAVHNNIRHPGKPFNKTMDAIEMILKNRKIRLSVCSTIRQQNLKEIPSIFDFLLNLGVPEFRLMRLIPLCQKTAEFNQMTITGDDYLDLLVLLLKQTTRTNEQRVNPIIVRTDEPYYYVAKLSEKGFNDILRHESCQQGKSIVSIASDGSIMPCSIANYESCVAGNIKKDNLFDVWNKSEIFRPFRESNLADGCRKCKFSSSCVSGCRCAALGYFGKLTSPDPGCPLSLRLSKSECETGK